MKQLLRRLPLLATILAAVAAALAALLSLRWPVCHDLPLMLYNGFLIADLDWVPYRDFFDMNPPGTMLAYTWLHQLTGGADLACRVADLLGLALVCGCTCVALRTFGRWAGVLASVCFVGTYLGVSPNLALQREYLGVVALAASLAVTFRATGARKHDWIWVVVNGALAGAAFSIKPPLILCWVPLGLYEVFKPGADRATTVGMHIRTTLRVGAWFALGAAAVLLPVIGWLIVKGGFGAYLEMAREYYPLYTQLGGTGEVRAGGPAALFTRFVTKTLPVVQGATYLPLSLGGLGIGFALYREPAERARVLVLASIALLSVFYIPLSGKFWLYHAIPLYFALSLLAGLAVSRAFLHARSIPSPVYALVAAGILIGTPVKNLDDELARWRSGESLVLKEGNVDFVEAYVEQHLGPDETVLALETSSGIVHGLYRTRRPLCGRFIYDLHFYHHVDTPYVTALRRELLTTLDQEKPTYVIRAPVTWRPHTRRGPESFDELEAYLATHYGRVADSGTGVLVLRRTREASPP